MRDFTTILEIIFILLLIVLAAFAFEYVAGGPNAVTSIFGGLFKH